MPGFVTHELFGLEVFRALPTGVVRGAIKAYFPAFRLGLQGPDLLFYDLFSMIHQDYRSVGAYMHEHRINEFFRRYLNRLHRMEGEARGLSAAYLAGFLCHHTSDRFCHPYIYARSGHKLSVGERGSFPAHARLENEIDAALLMRQWGEPVTALRQADVFALPKRQRQVISAQFGAVLREVYGDLFRGKGRRLSPGYVNLCIRLGAVEARLQMDPKGRKTAATQRLERLLHIPHIASSRFIAPRPKADGDCLNLSRALWRNPWNPSICSHDSFLDLYDTAQRCAQREFHLLEGFLTGKTGAAGLLGLIAGASYHSGLPEDKRLAAGNVCQAR